jgi:hypothetical protein
MPDFKPYFKDISIWTLLVSNIITIILAIIQHWNLATVMMIYWFQSIIIGVFNFFRILELQNFSVTNIRINNMPAIANSATKISMAVFFAFHYGFFHLVYFIFVMNFAKNSLAWSPILLMALVFFINNLFSHFYNRSAQSNRTMDLGKVFFYPYLRILPMHFTIFIAGFLGVSTSGAAYSVETVALAAFLILKTIADVGMYIVEGKILPQ